MTTHIRIPDVAPVVRFNANGTDTAFAYNFPIFDASGLAVYLDGAQQVSGFDVSGAGETEGGTVTFDTAPASGTVVTLIREMPLQRVTDFLEGGDFSADAINTELDYLVAALQQVERRNDLMLKYSDTEAPGETQLPDKDNRANKALGFDSDGNPVAVSLEGSMAAPDFTPSGTGAQTRTSSDKFSDLISIKDFGAVGDGVTDDTIAIQNAIAAHNVVFVPHGSFLITSTIALANRQGLVGLGQSSIIEAQDNSFNVVEMQGARSLLHNLRISYGNCGLRLYGDGTPCRQNVVQNVHFYNPNTGICIDGYSSSDNSCESNNFINIIIERPEVNGVHLYISGAGDAPSANVFSNIHVMSFAQNITGHGFYIEDGALYNSFVNCRADIDGSLAQACFRVGSGASDTSIVNLLCVSDNSVPNVQLDAGSSGTSIVNLNAKSNGAVINDLSSGAYQGFNTGASDSNTLSKTATSDLRVGLLRYDTNVINTAGTTAIDLADGSVYLADANASAITVELPAASASTSAVVTVKKTDTSANIVSITENGGSGADGQTYQLGGIYDFVTMISDGTSWHVISSNRAAGGTRSISSSGTVDIDVAVDVYLLSSSAGAMTARLPPANADKAKGRMVTLKKTDSSVNAVTVTEQGGSGPDGASVALSSQYDSVTVVSNGSNWFTVSTFG